MRFKKAKLKRKLKAGQKPASHAMQELKEYTLAAEAKAKLDNSVARDVFTQVAEQAGSQAPKVFSYTDWKLPKRERMRRLMAMYKGPQSDNVLKEAAEDANAALAED